MTLPRNLLGWVVAAGAVLNVVVYLSYTVPRTVQGRRLETEKARLEEEVARQTAALAAHREYTQTLAANVEDARRFQETVIAGRTDSLVPTLSEIEGMAREGGLQPGAASYKVEAVKGLPVDRFVITMPVSGTYRQLVSFIERVEASPHFLTLDAISVRGAGEGGGAKLDMVLSSYFRSS